MDLELLKITKDSGEFKGKLLTKMHQMESLNNSGQLLENLSFEIDIS